MKEMTLREICNTFNVSRRAIQGYEKAGLVSASARNERGYLLYDENSQERIKQIKLFQQMGFTIKEIKDIIDAPKDDLKSALVKRLKEMEKEKTNMEKIIQIMYEMIKNL